MDWGDSREEIEMFLRGVPDRCSPAPPTGPSFFIGGIPMDANDLKVADVMTAGVETVRPKDTLQAAAERMRARCVGMLLVARDRSRPRAAGNG
jgi:hypothetical protein